MSRKTIIFLVNSLGNGGAERVCSILASELSSNYDVTIVAFSQSSASTYSLDKRVSVVVLNKRAWWSNLNVLIRLIGVVDRIRPDSIISMSVVHWHFVWWLSLISGVRFKWHCRFAGNYSAGRLTFLTLLRNLPLARATSLVCNDEDSAADLAKHFPRYRSKIKLILNPIDHDLPQKVVYQEEVKSLVYVGRLSPEKGIDFLIEAFGLVAIHFPSIVLNMFGDGPERESLERRCLALGLQDKVMFRGFCPDISELLVNEEIILLTSEHESSPNAIAEAQAIGLPAVVLDCDYGPRNIVVDQETGILVRNRIPEQFALAVCGLIRDRDKRIGFGRKAVLLTREKFRIEPVLRRWKELIETQAVQHGRGA